MKKSVGSLALALAFAAPVWAEHGEYLETVVVTATRDHSSLSDTAASVGVLDEDTVRALKSSHSSELLNRISGVNIVQLGSSGEGVAAAIRQPVSYSPVYLYLENGVPTRSAGFFNHNALYEVNTSVANGVEIIKGPGSALYGSDAIGAVINILSGQPPRENARSMILEAGADGWRRAQLNAAQLQRNYGFTARINVSNSDGWRDQTAAQRRDATLSWAWDASDSLSLNTVLTASTLDMETGGSGLRYNDYRQDPEQAGNRIGFRDVSALRLSSAIEKRLDSGALTVTPYLRSNELQYVATWTLNSGRVQPPPPWCSTCLAQLDSQDAHINDSGHDSAGVLVKYRHDLSEDSFVIVGVDLDATRGYQQQTYIERTDSDAGPYWLSYREAGELYDYTVDFFAASPYVHLEQQLSPRWRLTAGVRYDSFRYDYDNRLADIAAGSPDDPATAIYEDSHYREPDQIVEMEHFSPKLGLIFDISDSLNAYTAYRHAFRIPDAGQMFRAGATVDATSLEPVKANSLELGLRGNVGARLAFDAALYRMEKRDDILSVTEASGARRNVNAGQTGHYGLELNLDIRLTGSLDLGLAYSRAKHRFADWQDGRNDYSGNDMPDAPEDFANLRLSWHPPVLGGGRVELEGWYQGEHWLDENNDSDGVATDRDRYKGHTLINLRADYPLTDAISLYTRVLNLTDRHYAETTSKWGPRYTPGRPRTAFVGVNWSF